MSRFAIAVVIILKAMGVLGWIFASAPWISAAFFFVPDFWVLYQLFVPSAQGACRTLTHFQTDSAEIWLTIDDGPDDEDTPRILELLERHQARATFFLIGERAARRPDLVAEILRRGHEVGHHTHTHPTGTFWCASPATIRKEIDDGLAALQPAGPRWFRPPVGIRSPFLAPVLAARGLQCVAWNVRSLDSFSRDPAAVVHRVMARVCPGSIVLMHEGAALHPAVRVRALAGLLEALAARQFRCVLPEPGQLR